MQSKGGTAAGKKQENAELHHFPPSQANRGKWPGSPHSRRAVRDPAAVRVASLHTRDTEQLFEEGASHHLRAGSPWGGEEEDRAASQTAYLAEGGEAMAAGVRIWPFYLP